MVPNLNIAHFARMAHPAAAPAALQGYSAPAMPSRPPMQRPPMPGASRMAAQGRGGDSVMAHMTPGEIAVPPQVQTPEVLAALNKAFAQAGANPTSYQAGSPDQKVNPATGAPEFGFFDVALPLALGVAGSMFLGPEVLAPFLVDAGVGATTAGILGGAVGGGLGSTAGNLITGKPLGESLALGAAGAAGSALGGAALGGAFGSGPTPAVQVGQAAGLTDFGGGGAAMGVPDVTAPALTAGAPMTASGSAASNAMSAANIDKLAKAYDNSGAALSQTAAPGPIQPSADFGDWVTDKLANTNWKQTIGSALGGQIGESLVSDYFKKPATVDLGPSLRPLKDLPPYTDYVGGGIRGKYPKASTPDASYRPGVDSQFRYFG